MCGALELSTRIHTFHRTISSPDLTGLRFEDDDARTVLLFVRLRSLLFALCPDHPVALCETCHRTYTAEQLLSLPPLQHRSDRVGRRPRPDVPESHAEEAAGADGFCDQLDDPHNRFGAFRGPA